MKDFMTLTEVTIKILRNTLFTVLLLAGGALLSAQDQLAGTIIYQRTTTYTFAPTGNDEWDAYTKTLPTEGKFEKVLYFTSDLSFYDESTIEKEALTVPQQKAIFMASYGKAPRPVLRQLHCDFKKERKTELLEFMTRDFLIASDMEPRGWKLASARKKILGHTCMKASLNMEGDTVIAWFTPELSVPAGPAEYHGLPGIVLAVEREGETILLATSIDLTPPAAELLSKPDTGKKASRETFDRIVEEKVEEFEKNGPPKSNYHHRSP